MEFLLNPLIKKEEWNRFFFENGGPSSREATEGTGVFCNRGKVVYVGLRKSYIAETVNERCFLPVFHGYVDKSVNEPKQ